MRACRGHRPLPCRPSPACRYPDGMHVIVAGSRGLIGTRLVDALVTRGDRVTRLVRPTCATASTGDAQPAARAVVDRSWDPARRRLSPAVLDGADAVVVLNGTSIGHLPWTRSRRRALAVSRRDPVRTVVRALRELGTAAPPPSCPPPPSATTAVPRARSSPSSPHRVTASCQGCAQPGSARPCVPTTSPGSRSYAAPPSSTPTPFCARSWRSRAWAWQDHWETDGRCGPGSP